MKKKILIFTSFFPPEKGAASNRMKNMALGLQRVGYDVQIVCPLPNYPKGKLFPNYERRIRCVENIDGVNVRRYWIYPTISKKPFKRFLSMFSFSLSLFVFALDYRRFKADYCIVQGHPMFVSWTAMIISKWLLGAKTILNVSDLWPLTALEIGVIRRGRVYSLLEKIETFNYKHADAVLGQSDEILKHVDSVVPNKCLFLYRNLPIKEKTSGVPQWHKGSPHLVYAGLLGYAQGIANIVKSIDWKKLGVRLAIYGEGGEFAEIKKYLQGEQREMVEMHGMVSPADLRVEMPRYSAALVPLAMRIKGAVPSKIYELAYQGMPVLFSGGGEGAEIVAESGMGFLSEPGNMTELEKNICSLSLLNQKQYNQIVANCQKAAQKRFDFNSQIKNLEIFFNKI